MGRIAASIALPVIIEKGEFGFVASCPVLQGCYSQGETYTQVLGNIRDAAQMHIEYRQAKAKSVPTRDTFWVDTIDIPLASNH